MKQWIQWATLACGLAAGNAFAQDAAAPAATAEPAAPAAATAPAAVEAEAAPATAAAAPAATGTGTLVVNVLPFSSEVELRPRVEEQLRAGGLEWGLDGNHLVFTMINKQFIDFPINHMTRYGRDETLTLPAGDYRLTGIGLEMTTSFSVKKMLEKGGYFNEDILRFRIEEGQTTTVTINPIIRRDMTMFVKFFMPALATTIVSPAGTSEETIINARNGHSVNWPQYDGPLKFVAE